MKRQDNLRRLEERLARGEISEKTYLEIKARYESEPEEPEEPEPTVADIGSTIGAAVAQATQDAGHAAEEAVRAVGEAMRAVEFSGIGAKLSDEEIRITGSGIVTGNPVRTVDFKAAGSGKVQGSLEAEVARVAGSCSFEGDVTVSEFRSAGSSRIAGRLKADEIEASGSLQVEGDILGDEISSSGSLQVRGKVEVEEIELEATTAALVKGDEVRIGPHCRIDVVEAKDLVVHQSSEVRERRTPSGGVRDAAPP